MRALLFWLLVIPGALWAGTALWVQFPALRLPVLAGFGVAVLVVVALRLFGPPGWGWLALLLASLGIGGWYLSLRPAQHLDWAPDVARIVKGRVDDGVVQLDNLRRFRWSNRDTATEAWDSRAITLADIEGVDAITSVWGSPLIAHLLVSFRIREAEPVTFSVEIRREKGEDFSAIGGFFRKFELALVAADEADILQWRAVARGEEMRLYPLDLTPAQAQAFFLSFVDLGNRLNDQPQWYNTITANCTTVVWQLARVLEADLPMDPRLLISGWLPDYLDGLGLLNGAGGAGAIRAGVPMSERLRNAVPDAVISDLIRQP